MGRLSLGALLVLVGLTASGKALGWTGRAEAQRVHARVCIFDRSALRTAGKSCRPRARKYPGMVKGSVRRAIYDGALTFGIPYSVLMDVAQCESNLNPRAWDGVHGGIFQFLPATFRGAARKLKNTTGIQARSYWNPLDAAYVAGYLFATGQSQAWSCSGQSELPPAAQ